MVISCLVIAFFGVCFASIGSYLSLCSQCTLYLGFVWFFEAVYQLLSSLYKNLLSFTGHFHFYFVGLTLCLCLCCFSVSVPLFVVISFHFSAVLRLLSLYNQSVFFIFQCLSLQSIFSSVMILNLIFGKFVFLLLSVCFCHDSLRSSCISVQITGIILFKQSFCVSLGPLCQFVVILHAFLCALCLFKLIFIYTFLSFSGCVEYLWGFSSFLGVFAVISYLFLVIL